jgi:hypothetical protein
MEPGAGPTFLAPLLLPTRLSMLPQASQLHLAVAKLFHLGAMAMPFRSALAMVTRSGWEMAIVSFWANALASASVLFASGSDWPSSVFWATSLTIPSKAF